MRSLLVAATLTLGIASSGAAQIEIDLAASPADLTIWGGASREGLGEGLQVGDVNGDDIHDILFAQPSWINPAQEVVGRVCVYFGPFSLPSVHDLFDEKPPLCIEGNPQHPIGHIATSLVAADIDADGIQDLIFPTWSTVSIFKGRQSWPPVLSVQDADWSFAEADSSDGLTTAAAGDLNGDFVPDLVLFAGFASGPSNARERAGEGYIFFGPATSWRKRHFDLAVDSPDVIIYGADGRADNPTPSDGDYLGFRRESIDIGNLVGDSTADLIVAAENAAGDGNLSPFKGSAYVFRGRPIWPPIIDLRVPGSADLLVDGPQEGGIWATAVGDIDGDAVPDLLLSSLGYSRPGLGRPSSGGVFVLRGGAGLSGVWDLATTAADMTIVARATNANFGFSLGVGDVNGDSYVDILVGAGETPFPRLFAEAVFTVSGCEGLEPLRDLAVVPAELIIYGVDSGDVLGRAVITMDFDGDGRDDILMSARGGEGRDNLRGGGAGEIHLVLGRPLGAPVCTITPNPGAPASICGTTTDVTLDGASSIVSNCGVTPQYRWMDGTTELRGWDVDPTFVVRPTATTPYRLEVRCGDCAGPCFETATVLVTVDPDVTPPSLGNTVRAYRSGTDVELGWASVTEARTYSLYRGTQKEAWPPVPLSSLTTTTATLPDVAGPPNLYFYRVAGASCSATEGP